MEMTRKRSGLAIIFFTVFIDLVGFGVIIPLLPFYAEHFNASPDAVTLLMAIYSLTQFFFAPFWGRLSDRIGRKPVLMISLLGIAVAYVGVGFSQTLWELFLARAAAGAMAGNIAAAQAYISDVTPPEKRAHGMGLIGAAFGLGFILGPAIGGILGGSDPTQPNFLAPALTAAALSLAACLFALAMLKESHRPEAGALEPRRGRFQILQQALTSPGLQRLVILFFLVTFVFSGMESVFALWSERAFGWGATQNGYVFAYTGLVAAAVQGGLIRRLRKRFGEPALILQGAAVLLIGFVLIPLSHSLPILLVAMACLAYGASLCSPSLSSLISLRAAGNSRGSMLGVSQSAASLARILGPAAAGALFTIGGRNLPFLAGGAVVALVLLVALGLRRASEASSGA